MKKIKLPYIVLTASLLIALLTWKSYGETEQNPPSTTSSKWRYTVLRYSLRSGASPQGEIAELNNLGKQGWELVSYASETAPVSPTKTGTVHVFYFKRPVP